ncbi:TonB-dependent siderophore receptor [Piscinibacter sp.]|uniref:TonB-dependent siderophore receptor n=1 Tax=Piscinibacter sp. TaxID=1903157 RepID=UPI0039E56524
MTPPTSRRHALALAAYGLALALHMPVASAQQAPFDIAAQPLATALDQFARQAGLQLVFSPALAQGRQAPAVQGTRDVRQALDELLRGSGLAGRIEGGTLTVAPLAKEPAEATLPAVKVTAQPERSGSTEGTGSYTTRSTEVATGLNLSLRETPQSVTVITRERMDDGGTNTLVDVAAQAPGISIIASGASVGGFASLYARGYEVKNFMLDGVPVPTWAIAAYAFQGLSYLDSAVYDSVAVVRGATGLLAGAGDPSATVALARKRPTPEFQASLSQSLGTWRQRRTLGDAGGPLNEAGTLRGRVVGVYEAGHGWKEGYGYDKYTGYAVLEADLSSRTLATLALEFGGDHGRGAGPYMGYALSDVNGDPTGFGRSDSAVTDWSFYRDRRIALTAALEHRFNDDWQVKLAYNRNQVKDNMHYGLAGDWPEPDGTVPLHLRSYRRKNDVDSLSLKADGRYELWGRKHEVTLGFNGAWAKQKTPVFHVDLDNLVDVYTWNRQFPQPDWTAFDEPGGIDKVGQYGFWAATRLRATDQLSVLAGARWTAWRSRSLDAAGVMTDDRKENGVLTPYVGVMYDLTPGISAYASYTTIFNPQSSRDVNGRLLDPETGKNIEAGIKGEWFGGRLNASAAVFQVKKNNLAVLDDGNLTPGGDDAYRAEDDTRGRGWEVELAGEPLPGWRVQGGYTRMVLRDSGGLRLANDQPKHLFKLFTTWTPAGLNQLTVGGGVTWQSATFTDWVDESWRELYTQKSYAVVNLMARYAFSEPWTLTLNFNNVFDKAYRTDMAWHEYGPPRNLQATLQYKF